MKRLVGYLKVMLFSGLITVLSAREGISGRINSGSRAKGNVIL